MGKQEEDWLLQWQQVLGRMQQEQAQALQHVCPHCWGPLSIVHLYKVAYPVCNLTFDVQDIINGVTKK